MKAGSNRDIRVMTIEMIWEELNESNIQYISREFKTALYKNICNISVEMDLEFQYILKLQDYLLKVEDYLERSGQIKNGLKILRDDKLINNMIIQSGIKDDLSKAEKYIIIFSVYRGTVI